MATVSKDRNGRWRADYVDKHGTRRRARPKGSFRNSSEEKRAAQQLLTKRLQDATRGIDSITAQRLKFEEAAVAFLDSRIGIGESTRRSYESLLSLYPIPYFDGWKLSEISVKDVERFRNELLEGKPPPVLEAFMKRGMASRPGLSRARARQRAKQSKPGPRTVEKVLGVTGQVFRYAIRNQWLDLNPCSYVEKPKKVVAVDDQSQDDNILTPKEIGRLITAANPARWSKDGALIGNNDRLFFELAIYSGARVGELFALSWDDVNWVSNEIFIRRTYSNGVFSAPKTASSVRQVELPSPIMKKLREWKLACPNGERNLVLPNLRGGTQSHTNFSQRTFHPTLRRAGIRKIRIHDLRHTYGSLLIAAGENIVRVSRLLGHANPSITLEIYSHALPAAHYRSADRLSEYLSNSELQ